jgi:hypothetical protein
MLRFFGLGGGYGFGMILGKHPEVGHRWRKPRHSVRRRGGHGQQLDGPVAARVSHYAPIRPVSFKRPS